MAATRRWRGLAAVGLLGAVSAACPATAADDVWRAPAGAGVRVSAEGTDRWRVASANPGGFVLESVQRLDARPGDAFEVAVSIRVDIHTRALPVLVCLDARGRAIDAGDPLANAPGTFSTNVQAHRRAFAALPGTAAVRAGIAIEGRGEVELAGLQFGPAEVDTYRTGALVRPLDAALRKGVVLESNFGIVDAARVSSDDRDGDGRWALVTIDLDRLTEPSQRGEDWRSRFEVNPNVVLWSDGAVLKSDTIRDDARPDPARALHFRAKVRPGPYQVRVSDPGRSVAVSLDGRTWSRREGGREIDLGTLDLASGVVELWLDACHRDPVSIGPAYFDYVRLIPAEDPKAVERLFRAAARRPPRLERGTAEETAVAVAIDDPPTTRAEGWPVRCGLPLPRGDLVSAEHVAVETARGVRVPSSARVMAEWPDGSVKWLLVDFLHTAAAAPGAPADGRYRVVYGQRVNASAPARPVTVNSQGADFLVDTGAIRFRIARSRFGIVEDVQRADGRPALEGPISAEILESGGRRWRALDLPLARLELEQAGPLHAVIVAETARPRSGTPSTGFAHRARIHAFAGSPVLQVEYFVANTDDRSDPDPIGSMAGSVPVRSVSLKFPMPTRIRQVQNELGPAEASGGLVQTDPELGPTGGEARRKRLLGWLAARLDDGGGFALGLEHFREQFPKAVRWRPDSVDLDLWAIEGGTFDWSEGVGKTHHITLDFGDAPSDGALLARGRLFAFATPEWYCASGAFGPIGTAAASPMPAVEKTLAGHMRDPVVERVGLGFENFGDHSSGGYVKGTFLWDNNEYDLPAACLVHFARTGDRDAFRIGLASALHYVDVDMVHYSSRHAAWHEAQHVHSHGNLGHHTAQGPDMSHAGYVQGLIWSTYLTGEPAGLEGAKGIAAWVLRSLGTHTTGMERQLGHPLMTLNDLYEATGDERWLRGSARLVDQALKWEHPLRSGFLAPITESPAYASGSPFCGGLITAALLKFNGWADLPEVDAMLERVATWTLTDVWRPPAGIQGKGGSPRRRGEPRDIASHLRLMAAVHHRTGDPFFLVVPRKSLAAGFGDDARPFGTRATGVVYNYAPWFLQTLHHEGGPTDDGGLVLRAVAPRVSTPRGREFTVAFDLENRGPGPIDALTLSTHARLDFAAATTPAPPRQLLPGESRRVVVTSRAPEHLNLSCEANRMSHLHLSAGYTRAGAPRLAHGWVEIVVEEPKPESAPPATR